MISPLTAGDGARRDSPSPYVGAPHSDTVILGYSTSFHFSGKKVAVFVKRLEAGHLSACLGIFLIHGITHVSGFRF